MKNWANILNRCNIIIVFLLFNVSFIYECKGHGLEINFIESNIDSRFRFSSDYIHFWRDNIFQSGQLKLFPSCRSFQNFTQNQFLFESLIRGLEGDSVEKVAVNSESILQFVTGSKKSNALRISHNQTLGNKNKFVIDFFTRSSMGFFQREKSADIFFNPKLELNSKNEKFHFGFEYCSYKLNKENNGGITSDSIFLNSAGLNSDLNPINLKQSESLNKIKNSRITNSYLLYSTDTARQAKFQLKGIEARSFLNYSSEGFGFYSEDKGYFINYFNDSTQTKDTASLKSLSHQLTLSFTFVVDSSSIVVTPYFLNGTYDYRRPNATNHFESYGIGGNINFINEKIGFSAKIKMESVFVEEFSQNQKRAEAIFSKQIWKNHQIMLGVSFEENFSSLLSQSYYSNNFIWNNSFKNERTFRVHAGLSGTKPDEFYRVRFEKFSNYLFFDTSATPNQSEDGFSLLSFDIKREINFGNFGIVPALTYTTLSNDNLYHYPEFILRPEIFYSRDFFKKRLNIKTGVGFFYYSSFFADSYMPVTDQYYLQSSIKTGNYPMLNYFLKLKIKRVEVFLEINHLNEGLSGRNYFLTPHYPMPGRNILFGVNWQLIN